MQTILLRQFFAETTSITCTNFKDIWIPLIAALVGGLIGSGFALLAGIQAHKNNLKLDQLQKKQNIDGVLLAIRSELEILAATYMQQAGGLLSKIKEDETFNVYFSLKQQYFIVYPSNTNVIGQIDDNDLVKSIVVTYNTANFLIESFLINNRYLDMQKENQGMHAQSFLATRVQHATGLKAINKKLFQETESLLVKIDNYRAKN